MSAQATDSTVTMASSSTASTTLTISLDHLFTINHTHLTAVLAAIVARLDSQAAHQAAGQEAQATQIAALQTQVGALTDRLEASRDHQHAAAIADIQCTLHLQGDAIGATTSAVAVMSGQVEVLVHSGLAGQVGVLEQQVSDLTAQLTQVTTDLAHAKSAASSPTPAPQSTTTTTPSQQSSGDVEKRISELTSAVAQQHDHVAELNNTVEVQQSVIQHLQSQLSHLQSRTTPRATGGGGGGVHQQQLAVDSGLEQRVVAVENKLSTNDIQTKVILNKMHVCNDTVKQHDGRLTELDSRLQALVEQTAAAAAATTKPTKEQAVASVANVDTALTERVTNVEALVDTLNTKLTALTVAPPRTALTISSSVLDSFSGADGDKLKQYLSDQFAIIYAHEAKYTSDIADLYAKLTTVKQSIGGVTTQSFDTAQLVSDLLHRFEALQHDVHKRLQHIVSKQYVDKQHDDMRQLQHQHEKVIDKQLKTELKRFENDLLALLAANPALGGGGGGQHSGGGHATAIGSMQFKCISCDQPTAAISGPATLQFTRNVSGANVVPPISADRATTQLLIDKSSSVYAYSDRDDKFYKSRLATPQLYLKPADADSAHVQHFDVKYLHEPSNVTQNAYGVNGSVAYSDVENLPPVVSAGSNHNGRPVSAAIYAVTGKAELTRPHTSAGLLPKTLKKK